MPQIRLDSRAVWIVDAKCKGMNIEKFFPIDSEEAKDIHPDARAACESCPVAEPCLEWALRHESHGFQGGMTAGQRHRERGRRRMALYSPQQNLIGMMQGR